MQTPTPAVPQSVNDLPPPPPPPTGASAGPMPVQLATPAPPPPPPPTGVCVRMCVCLCVVGCVRLCRAHTSVCMQSQCTRGWGIIHFSTLHTSGYQPPGVPTSQPVPPPPALTQPGPPPPVVSSGSPAITRQQPPIGGVGTPPIIRREEAAPPPPPPPVFVPGEVSVLLASNCRVLPAVISSGDKHIGLCQFDYFLLH